MASSSIAYTIIVIIMMIMIINIIMTIDTMIMIMIFFNLVHASPLSADKTLPLR